MSENPANPYLRTKVMTASPEELRLMLYEGAIKFCRQGRDAMAKQDFEAGYNSLMRAQKIVLELSTSLDHAAAPDLCTRLGALYTYIYKLLVDANMSHETTTLDEALELLEYEAETWKLLMQRLAEEGGLSTDAPINKVAGAQQTAMSSLSISG